MGGGPNELEVPSRPEPSGAPEDAPADRPATDAVAHDISEVPAVTVTVTELDGASSQSPRPGKNDAVGIESHEKTKVDDTEDDTATVTGESQDPANAVAEEDETETVTGGGQDSANAVATEVETVRADNQNAVHHDPEKIIMQPETRPIAHEQLVAEVKAIYAGLVMVENKCIEVDDGQMPWTDGPLDIPSYLLTIPEAKLILLQDGNMQPAQTVRLWYVKAQKDATKGDKKWSTLESTTKDLPATSQDLPVLEKTAPQVGSDQDYLRGFQVALELRAKKHRWPEYKQLAVVNVAEMGEETRNKVIDGKYYLNIGYDLVDQFLRDLETVKRRAEEEEAVVASEKAAPEATAPQEAEVTPKLAEEAFEQIAPKEANIASEKVADVAFKEVAPEITPEEVETEEGFVEVTPEEAVAALENVDPEKKCPKGSDADVDAALEEAAATQQPPDHDANLSAQEPQPSPVKADADADKALEITATQQNSAQDASLSTPESQTSAEEACVAPENVGKKDTADTAVDAVALDEKTKSESERKPAIKWPIYVDMRPLSDQSRYKKVGREQWVLISGRWIPSLRGEQYAALLALHRKDLHEHHDFFLASQHPSASLALRRLAKKYAMPARMWRYGVHSFLEVLRKRLPESQEIMEEFIMLTYGMMCSLDETVPNFRFAWIECKGDLARYGMAVEEKDMEVKDRWRYTSREEYTRARNNDPTVGRLYHHLAILVRSLSSSPDARFDADVSRLFYFTKSLVVEAPFYATRESVLTAIEKIVDRNKEAAEKPASVPQTDQDHFLTAVAHLILASLGPETLRNNGYRESRNDHLQTVYAALEKIKVDQPAKTSRIRPSAKLGLLLCQLLLGIPLADKRWSPMMAAFAPDLVTAEDRADVDAMANARDIHDATIELINTMVPYLLEDADTGDLGLWGFILIMLFFMRTFKTRPDLRDWLGSAFHAEALPAYFNLALREDEVRGAAALESAFQSELVTICSPLNERKRLGKYAFSTEDNIKRYLRDKEEQQRVRCAKSTAVVGEVTAEETTAQDATATPEAGTVTTDDDAVATDGNSVSTDDNSVSTGKATVTTEATAVTPKGSQTTAEESMATTEQTTASDATHKKDMETKTPGPERMFANFLPEHDLVTGLFFAKEAESGPCDKSLETLTKEAKEEEVRRQEGLRRDPPLFPNGWLDRSKHGFDEMAVCDYVQSLEMCNDRLIQILRLATQLTGVFFDLETDEEGRPWFSVPGASSVPKLGPNKMMPEIIECDSGSRVVFVDPSSHAVEIKKEEERLARAEERRKKKERQKEKKENAEAVPGAATVVDEKAEGNAEEQPAQSERSIDHVNAKGALKVVSLPTGAPSIIAENGDDEVTSAFDPELRKTTLVAKTSTAAEKPSSTDDAEPTESEARTTLPVPGVNDPQHSKGSDAGPDTDAAAASVDDQAAATVEITRELTQDVLDKMPKKEKRGKAIRDWRAPIKGPGVDKDEDEDGWTHVSDDSLEDDQPDPTVQSDKADTRSMASRWFLR